MTTTFTTTIILTEVLNDPSPFKYMAQIKEVPYAISQGKTMRSACLNVLDALEQLKHSEGN